MKKILLVASSGGHWIQLTRLSPAFEQMERVFVSTFRSKPIEAGNDRYLSVKDASMWDKPALIVQMLQVGWIVLRHNPDIVLTTGAAPGYFAMVFGRLLGRKTIWIDSIANADELSLAGLKARKWTTHWLTQWEHLAQPDGPHFIGSVL